MRRSADYLSVSDRKEVLREYWPAIARLLRAHEADAAARQDLEQEIALALWRSLAGFREQCALRTWVYRVANNVIATHVSKAVRHKASLTLEELETSIAPVAEERLLVAQLQEMIAVLAPLDRALFVLYLEGVDNQVTRCDGQTALGMSRRKCTASKATGSRWRDRDRSTRRLEESTAGKLGVTNVSDRNEDEPLSQCECVGAGAVGSGVVGGCASAIGRVLGATTG